MYYIESNGLEKGHKMKAYILSIAVSAIIAAAVNMISPDKWAKYTGIVTGLVIVLCIGRPILELADTDAFAGFRFDETVLSNEGEKEFRGAVKMELENQLEGDIKARVKNEFGRDCTTDVIIGVNDSGEITGVDKIIIYGKGFDNAVTGRLRELYGAKEIVTNGSEKVSQKTE